MSHKDVPKFLCDFLNRLPGSMLSFPETFIRSYKGSRKSSSDPKKILGSWKKVSGRVPHVLKGSGNISEVLKRF